MATEKEKTPPPVEPANKGFSVPNPFAPAPPEKPAEKPADKPAAVKPKADKPAAKVVSPHDREDATLEAARERHPMEPKVKVVTDPDEANRPVVTQHLPTAAEKLDAQALAEADVRKRSNEAARKQAELNNATNAASFLPNIPEDSNPGL